MRLEITLVSLIFVTISGILLLGVIAAPPSHCQTYNEMRQIWEYTNGEFGWPEGAVKECEK